MSQGIRQAALSSEEEEPKKTVWPSSYQSPYQPSWKPSYSGEQDKLFETDDYGAYKPTAYDSSAYESAPYEWLEAGDIRLQFAIPIADCGECGNADSPKYDEMAMLHEAEGNALIKLRDLIPGVIDKYSISVSSEECLSNIEVSISLTPKV